MSRFKQAPLQDGSKPRLTPLPDFLDRNGLDPIDYLLEVLGGETGMPPPIPIAGSVYIETDTESRWRNRAFAASILRIAEVTNTGGRRHARR